MSSRGKKKGGSNANRNRDYVYNNQTRKQERDANMSRPVATKNTSATFFSTVVGRVKKFFGTIGKRVSDAWKRAPEDTKHWLAAISAVSVLLLFFVIVLAVRLHGVSKEVKGLQTVTATLQTEIDNMKLSMEEEESQAVVAKPLATPTPIPTTTPVPTDAATPTPEPKRYVVCIDAGHGDWDGGATLRDENNRDIRIEKDDNLWMAKLLEDALKAYDVDVVMTRDTDVYLELTERTDIANREMADVLISFHRNSVAVEPGQINNEVTGAEIWVHNSKPQDAVVLAEELMQVISRVGGMRNRGVKFGTMTGKNENYAINRYANMTSMLIEYGFVTSSVDNEAYDKNGIACAEAMAKAIYEWLLERAVN